jgi:uncharacterized membrane protein
MVGIKDPSRKFDISLLFIFSIWLAFVLLAPFAVPYHSVDGLSGKGGQVDNWKTIDKMSPIVAPAYILGDMFCIELSDHSYYLNGNQMPFCARCTGIFAGLVIGMLLAVRSNLKVNNLLIGLGILPLLIDGGLQLVTSYQSTNPLRVATGLLAGAAVSLYLSHATKGAKNSRKAKEIESSE